MWSMGCIGVVHWLLLMLACAKDITGGGLLELVVQSATRERRGKNSRWTTRCNKRHFLMPVVQAIFGLICVPEFGLRSWLTTGWGFRFRYSPLRYNRPLAASLQPRFLCFVGLRNIFSLVSKCRERKSCGWGWNIASGLIRIIWVLWCRNLLNLKSDPSSKYLSSF